MAWTPLARGADNLGAQGDRLESEAPRTGAKAAQQPWYGAHKRQSAARPASATARVNGAGARRGTQRLGSEAYIRQA